MKNEIKIIFLAILFFGFFSLPWRVDAGINLPYSTSALSCSDYTQVNSQQGPTGCDGVNAYGTWMCSESNKGMQVTSDANYSGGTGGKGFRSWYGDSNNSNSAQPEFIFNSPPQELWVRYYARWQPGFTGGNLYQKMIYVFQNSGGGTPSMAIMALSGDKCEVETYGAAQETDVWYDMCGNTALGFDASTHLHSGAWQLIEYHIKLNTSGQSNGVVEMWINGALKFSRTNMNFGWTGIGRFLLPSNNKTLSNGACAYYDEDDIAFSATGRIGATGSSDTTAPTQPSNLTASATSSSQINIFWTASSDNVGVTGYRVYRGGTQIGTTAATSYSDTSLAASTSFSYAVAAYDGTGNVSTQSTAASATTQAVPPVLKTYTLTDFTRLVADWLKSMTGSPADVNLDNRVNSKDLGIIMSSWAN